MYCPLRIDLTDSGTPLFSPSWSDSESNGAAALEDALIQSAINQSLQYKLGGTIRKCNYNTYSSLQVVVSCTGDIIRMSKINLDDCTDIAVRIKESLVTRCFERSQKTKNLMPKSYWRWIITLKMHCKYYHHNIYRLPLLEENQLLI